jgi:hypothetical protein
VLLAASSSLAWSTPNALESVTHDRHAFLEHAHALLSASAASSSSLSDAAGIGCASSQAALSSQETEMLTTSQDSVAMPVEHERVDIEHTPTDRLVAQPASLGPASQVTTRPAASILPSSAASIVSVLPTRTPSQRERKKSRPFDEMQEASSAGHAVAAMSEHATAVRAASHLLHDDSTSSSLSARASSIPLPPLGALAMPSEGVLARSASAQKHRLVARERGGGLKVPKSPDHWIAVGVWVASRDFPELPFFVPLVDPSTGKRLDLPVPYKTMMATLSPKYNDRDRILLHSRVVQRTDAAGRLVGEVRYLCTDIAVSYHMGDNAFKWVIFHPTIFQVCCNTWNSSLNRRELLDHLGIAYQKGGMVFQAPEAEPTRRFLRAIILGKGLPAACTLKPMPQMVLGVPVTGAEAHAVAHTNSSTPSSLQPQCALQNLPNAMHLFLAALQRSDHLWFHPSLQEERNMGIDASAVQQAGSTIAAAAAARATAATAASSDRDRSSQEDADAEDGEEDDTAAAAATSVSNGAASSAADALNEEGANGHGSGSKLAHSKSMPFAGNAAAAASAVALEQSSPLPLSSVGRVRSVGRKSSSKVKESVVASVAAATEKPAMQAGILPFVQFVSVPQPATARSSALPCVHICNTLRPEAIARIEAAAAAAAAAGLTHTGPVPRKHSSSSSATRRPRMRKPPPHSMVSSDDDMMEVETHAICDTGAIPAAASAKRAAVSSSMAPGMLELLLGSAKMADTLDEQAEEMTAADTNAAAAVKPARHSGASMATDDVAAVALAAFASTAVPEEVVAAVSETASVAAAAVPVPPPSFAAASGITDVVPSPVSELELRLQLAAEKRRQAAAEALAAAEEEEKIRRELDASRAAMAAVSAAATKGAAFHVASAASAADAAAIASLKQEGEPAVGVAGVDAWTAALDAHQAAVKLERSEELKQAYHNHAAAQTSSHAVER